MTKYERIGSETDLKSIDRVRDAHVAALNQCWRCRGLGRTVHRRRGANAP